jgi:succinoglycan biosynthesis transport protein ExoP
MTLQQLLAVLRARWRRIFSVWLSFVLIIVLVCIFMPKKYLATADILVDIKSPDPVAGMFNPALMMPSYMATQIDVIQSRRIADKAIALVRLADDEATIAAWREDTDGNIDIKSWLNEVVSKHLVVVPSRDSNLISIGYKANDPTSAAAMANAFAQAFIETTIELGASPAGQNAAWFKDQVASLKTALDDAQDQLTNFRRDKGIIGDSHARVDAETTRLNELAAQLSSAQAQSASSDSRRAYKGDFGSSPEAIQNPFIQSLRSEIADTKAKLQDAGSRLGQNHPEYKRLAAQLNELQSQLGSQIGRLSASLGAANAQDAQKVDNILAAVNQQRLKVIDLNVDMDHLQVLQTQVDSAQKAYQTVADRYLQTNLQSQSSVTNVSLLTSASPPIEPSAPKPLLYIAVAVILGFIFGAISALVGEFSDRRIRSVEDFEMSLGMPLPLLGSVPSLTKASKIERVETARLAQLPYKSSDRALGHS